MSARISIILISCLLRQLVELAIFARFLLRCAQAPTNSEQRPTQEATKTKTKTKTRAAVGGGSRREVEKRQQLDETI